MFVGMTDELLLLLHRAGFGPTAAELAMARKDGYATTLAKLFTPGAPDRGASATPAPQLGVDYFADRPNTTQAERDLGNELRRDQVRQITIWWLDRMTLADHQAIEKLVFFWHGHWATSVEAIRSAQLMMRQHRTMRGAADFGAMARAMVVDPALNYWLDGHLNTRQSPNENLARELMELFTLGIGNYSENDVKEAGRALTGWQVDLGQEICRFDPKRHDPGPKTILGMTKAFTAASLVDMLLQHKETPRFIASRLWLRYGSSTMPIPKRTHNEVAAAYPAPMAMLRALMQDDAFRATTAGTLVKQPVEWMVGAMRQLGLRLSAMPPDVVTKMLKLLRDMGQVPFAPPNVGGWPSGASWLTSAAAQLRLEMAATLANQINVERISAEELAETLCVGAWSNRTHAVLREVKDPRRLITLGLASPEYLVT
jgi:uncharacterized protein (DUF1800 family)